MTPTEAYRAALEAALKIIQSNTTPCSAAYLWHWTGKEIMNYDAGQADAAHSFCNAIRALPVPDEPKRSFPDAADGSPSLPMEPELWAAGCDLDTARFVARQLAYDGYTLSKADELDRLRAENDRLRAALKEIARPKVGPEFDWTEAEVFRWRATWYSKFQDIARAALKGGE